MVHGLCCYTLDRYRARTAFQTTLQERAEQCPHSEQFMFYISLISFAVPLLHPMLASPCIEKRRDLYQPYYVCMLLSFVDYARVAVTRVMSRD